MVDKNGKPIGFVVYKDQDSVKKILQRSKVAFITSFGEVHMVGPAHAARVRAGQRAEVQRAHGPVRGGSVRPRLQQLEAAGPPPEARPKEQSRVRPA